MTSLPAHPNTLFTTFSTIITPHRKDLNYTSLSSTKKQELRSKKAIVTMVENKPEDPVETAIDKLKPILSELGFGSVMGYCSGMAMKKIGKAVAFAVGVGFIALQGAVSTGYIDVNWHQVKKDSLSKLDTTGDGNVDAEDVKVWWRKVKDILTNKLPSAGGFSLGFLYGVRHG